MWKNNIPLGRNIVSNNIVLSFVFYVVYLFAMCLNFHIFGLSHFIYALAHFIILIHVYWIWIHVFMHHFFIALGCAHGNFKLGGGVATYPTTFSQGLSSWNHPTLCQVLGLVVIGICVIPLPIKPLYYLYKGNHWDNKRPFWD
jgi:protein-S-isoprenylcysteine O-methyltransferase Ste14